MGQASARALISEETTCEGGNSYGCRKLDPHKTRQKYFCYRCQTDLGCKLCAMIPEELVCMRCRDMGHPAAMKRHGPVVHDRAKGAEALRIVGMIYKGSVSQEEGEQLIAELWRV
jgi:hypothetical protein